MLRPSSFAEWFRFMGVAGAIASFLWGVWVWKDKSDNELRQQKAEAQQQAESRRVEATKPFLEKQLKLYTEASQMAAQIATSDDEELKAKALARFWLLYWGELALVENSDVEAAMVGMRNVIVRQGSQSELQQASLKLTRACRQSLDKSWGIHAWVNPDVATATAEASE